MVAITKQQIMDLSDSYGHARRMKDNPVGYFLTLFDDDQPLQEEILVEWQEGQGQPIQAAQIKQCFNAALAEGWIEERPDGIFITEEGKKVAEDAPPPKMDIG